MVARSRRCRCVGRPDRVRRWRRRRADLRRPAGLDDRGHDRPPGDDNQHDADRRGPDVPGRGRALGSASPVPADASGRREPQPELAAVRVLRPADPQREGGALPRARRHLDHLQPDTPPGDIDTLAALARSRKDELVSRWDSGLPSPVVVTGWGRQLRLQSVSDPRLMNFVRQYANQGPEINAPC